MFKLSTIMLSPKIKNQVKKAFWIKAVTCLIFKNVNRLKNQIKS
jgi:hypothetical protein